MNIFDLMNSHLAIYNLLSDLYLDEPNTKENSIKPCRSDYDISIKFDNAVGTVFGKFVHRMNYSFVSKNKLLSVYEEVNALNLLFAPVPPVDDDELFSLISNFDRIDNGFNVIITSPSLWRQDYLDCLNENDILVVNKELHLNDRIRYKNKEVGREI